MKHRATTAPATAPGVSPDGSLNVRAQALQHIVETVALEVAGVHRTDPGLAGVRSGTPRATVKVRGTSARVQLEVACLWPASVTRIAADVRRHVLERASELSGVRLGSVDVAVKLAGIDDRRAS